MIRIAVTLLAVAAATAAAPAETVQVEVAGEVEYNQVSSGPFAAVNPGDPATFTFLVDSGAFADSPSFPTRGYSIDQASLALNMGSTTTGLQSPFPAGSTPYFVIRNDDPAVDGFFVSTGLDFPFGLPTEVSGAFGQFLSQFSVTYTGETLTTLDILDALGSYDYTGLTVFNFTVDDGPFQPIGLIFEALTISLPGAGCSADLDGTGEVNVEDLVTVILDWGCVPQLEPCSGDVNGDGITNVEDLVEVILQWGPCP